MKPQNTVNNVYQQMKRNIQDGRWAPGSKLPSESELIASFQVSRVSVRSAVQRLRGLGIVMTQQGKGTFVIEDLDQRGFNDNQPIMHLSQAEFEDMRVFRQTVEFRCMDLAVENATVEDIALIEAALNRMLVNRDDYKRYSQADFDFHYAIVKASHNKIFIHAMDSIRHIYLYYLEELNRVLGITLESVNAHINVYMAIKNHDAVAAAETLNQAMASNVAAMSGANPTD
ncbi:DNA-binding transcriptional regulator, FadR family [Pseudomonas flavescens]|uniref:DNA-binding transcriptional regulator, FadR family n=1 Tax=Phytopseudomonas flavescens TaxID=29435 RepID=A0A1G8KFZ8_9GAMM|nr:FadR/GntR family transcriptional regulator [Pseudomonas flavescens]SDI42351.1 DNA-binding transcriptional regulator, FadR family [Pseudomonas flavescens]